MQITAEVIIIWKFGLHIRPAAHIVNLLKGFSCNIVFEKNGERCNAKSPMQLLTLAAAAGETIQITTEGEDADAAMNALLNFFRNYQDGNSVADLK